MHVLVLALSCLCSATFAQKCTSAFQPEIVKYLIYPSNDGKNPIIGTDPLANADTERVIRTVIGDTEMTPRTYFEGLISWVTYLNADQACSINSTFNDKPGTYRQTVVLQEVKKINIELDAPINAPTPNKIQPRDGSWTAQPDPVTELRVIAQPTDVPVIKDIENYVYDKKAGEGVYIYAVEDGINTDSDDLKGRVSSEYIFGNDAKKNRPDKKDESAYGHATCVASKAVGSKYGVAKKATIIPVKINFNPDDISTIFGIIANDIRDKKREKKAVINISWGDPKQAVVPLHWISARIQLATIMRLGVPIVASAGNAGKSKGRKEIDTYPKIFSSSSFPIINVGNTHFDGIENEETQIGRFLHLWAAGTDVTCSEGTGTGHRVVTGTSVAAPQVAGQIAIFLSLDNPPFDSAASARNFMIGRASWVRNKESPLKPNVLWNLVTKDDLKTSSKP